MLRRDYATKEEIERGIAQRDALLASLTPDQRLAVYDWLVDENDYGDVLASWQWAEAWVGSPGNIPSWRDRL